MLTGKNAVKVYYDKYLFDHLKLARNCFVCFRRDSLSCQKFIGSSLRFSLTSSIVSRLGVVVYLWQVCVICLLVDLWELFFWLWAPRNQEGVIFKRSHKQKNLVLRLQRVLSNLQSWRVQTQNRLVWIWRKRARNCSATAQRMIQEGKNGRKILTDGKHRVELGRLVLEQRAKSGGTKGNGEGKQDWTPLFKFYVLLSQAMWTLLVESVKERWLKLKSYGWRKTIYRISPSYSSKIISMHLGLSMLKCFHCHRMGLLSCRDIVISDFISGTDTPIIASVWWFRKYNKQAKIVMICFKNYHRKLGVTRWDHFDIYSLEI